MSYEIRWGGCFTPVLICVICIIGILSIPVLPIHRLYFHLFRAVLALAASYGLQAIYLLTLHDHTLK